MILAICLGLSLISCCPNVDEEFFSFEIDAILTQNFDISSMESISGSDKSIISENYGIIIETTAPAIEKAEPQKRSGIFLSPDCSKWVDPTFILTDKVVEISVTSAEDFNAENPAGKNLMALFANIIITKDNPFATPPSFIEDVIIGENFFLNNFLISNRVSQEYRNQKLVEFYGLRLVAEPDNRIRIKFTVEMTFESGRKINNETEYITITP